VVRPGSKLELRELLVRLSKTPERYASRTCASAISCLISFSCSLFKLRVASRDAKNSRMAVKFLLGSVASVNIATFSCTTPLECEPSADVSTVEGVDAATESLRSEAFLEDNFSGGVSAAASEEAPERVED